MCKNLLFEFRHYKKSIIIEEKKNHRYLLLFIIETLSLNYLLQLVLL